MLSALDNNFMVTDNFHHWVVGKEQVLRFLMFLCEKSCFHKLVVKMRVIIKSGETTPEIISLVEWFVKRVPKTFSMILLEPRNKVIVTDNIRTMFAQIGFGRLLINWGSFIHKSKQIEKNGKRQPLNTWAIWITSTVDGSNEITNAANTTIDDIIER